MIFADFYQICSDFLRFSRKTLQPLKISRFQFNFSMTLLEIHLIFRFNFTSIDFKSNFHMCTTPAPISLFLLAHWPAPIVLRGVVPKRVRRVSRRGLAVPSTLGAPGGFLVLFRRIAPRLRPATTLLAILAYYIFQRMQVYGSYCAHKYYLSISFDYRHHVRP